MSRRLLVQFGVATLGLVLTTGMAFADSSNGGANTGTSSPTDQPGQAATVNTSDTLNIVDTTSNNQTIGGGTGITSNGNNSSGGSSAGSGNTVANTQPTNSGVNSSAGSSTPPISNDGQTPSGGSGAAGPTSPPAVNPISQTPTTAPASQTGSIRSAVQRAAAAWASNPSRTAQPELLATTAPSLPQQSTPGLPHAPVGFLAQLPLLMTQVLVPFARNLPLAAFPVDLAVSVLVGLFLLTKLISQLVTSTYTARLRRSGFLGAARSDVGAAILSFATPRKMSFICAYAT